MIYGLKVEGMYRKDNVPNLAETDFELISYFLSLQILSVLKCLRKVHL